MSAKKSSFWETNEARHREFIAAGCSDAECAARLSQPDNPVSTAAARQKRQAYGVPAPERDRPESVIRPLTQRPRLGHVLDLEPRPFAVRVPRPAKVQLKGKYQHAVWWSDSHMGYQSDPALDVVLGIIKEVRPAKLIHGGDLVDAYSISAFDKNPERLNSLQDEIDMAKAHLHQASQLAPAAEKVLLEGNHEDRLRRLIWKLPGTAAELAKLRAFRQAMTWPNLLGLDEIGWDFVPTFQQPLLGMLSKLALKHGDLVRKESAMTARAEYGRYTMSGISGHTHRLGKFYHRDLRDSHIWLEGGCTCRVTDVEYVPHPNWHQGCVVVTYKTDGSWFNAQEVYIENGTAMWGTKEFAA
jgi:hypothetical protein